MSSLLRSMQKRIFKRKGLFRSPRDGLITDGNDTNYGKHWPRGKTADTKLLDHD